MNTERFWNKILLLFVMLVASQTTSACNSQASSNSTNTEDNKTGVPDKQIVVEDASYITADSLQTLVAKSSLIVIGQTTNATETINMARNPGNIDQPDPNILGLGQVYRVVVERYLKGNGDKTLDIVQVEAFLNSSTPKTQENIAKARINYRYIPVRLGIRYLFFLEPVIGFTDHHYYTGPAHPWRFTLPDNGYAEPDSPWQGAKQYFPGKLSANLVLEVEQTINSSRSTLTAVRVPPAATIKSYP